MRPLESTRYINATVWTYQNSLLYLGDKVTIADILAVCEMLQVSATGRDMFVGRTTLQSWMERVRSAANPHFDEAHSVLYRLINKRKNHKL